jgi:SAM-dependent methyltransferase
VLFDRTPDAASSIYNYSLCHACGAVYAARRPAAGRYEWLLERFEETLGRTEVGAPRSGKFALSSSSLTDEARAQLRRMAANGVFVSGHSGITRKEFLPSLMNDRLASSMHVEILGSLLPMKAPRVLEIRSRLGSISAMLQRLYGASGFAMTIFENQRFLIEEVYGFPAVCPIDFDAFDIPFEGQFDLIVSNHMLTHTVRPKEFLAIVRSRLKPVDTSTCTTSRWKASSSSGASRCSTRSTRFTCRRSIRRRRSGRSRRNGFNLIFCNVRDDLFLALAQAADSSVGWERMGESERSRRRSAYRLPTTPRFFGSPSTSVRRLRKTGTPWSSVRSPAGSRHDRRTVVSKYGGSTSSPTSMSTRPSVDIVVLRVARRTDLEYFGARGAYRRNVGEGEPERRLRSHRDQPLAGAIDGDLHARDRGCRESRSPRRPARWCSRAADTRSTRQLPPTL